MKEVLDIKFDKRKRGENIIRSVLAELSINNIEIDDTFRFEIEKGNIILYAKKEKIILPKKCLDISKRKNIDMFFGIPVNIL